MKLVKNPDISAAMHPAVGMSKDKSILDSTRLQRMIDNYNADPAIHHLKIKRNAALKKILTLPAFKRAAIKTDLESSIALNRCSFFAPKSGEERYKANIKRKEFLQEKVNKEFDCKLVPQLTNRSLHNMLKSNGLFNNREMQTQSFRNAASMNRKEYQHYVSKKFGR